MLFSAFTFSWFVNTFDTVLCEWLTDVAQSQSPYGRPGQPAEIAPLYVALAASETSYANGQVWGADGGLGIF